jgi:hypothetical protein
VAIGIVENPLRAASGAVRATTSIEGKPRDGSTPSAPAASQRSMQNQTIGEVRAHQIASDGGANRAGHVKALLQKMA